MYRSNPNNTKIISQILACKFLKFFAKCLTLYGISGCVERVEECVEKHPPAFLEEVSDIVVVGDCVQQYEADRRCDKRTDCPPVEAVDGFVVPAGRKNAYMLTVPTIHHSHAIRLGLDIVNDVERSVCDQVHDILVHLECSLCSLRSLCTLCAVCALSTQFTPASPHQSRYQVLRPTHIATATATEPGRRVLRFEYRGVLVIEEV